MRFVKIPLLPMSYFARCGAKWHWWTNWKYLDCQNSHKVDNSFTIHPWNVHFPVTIATTSTGASLLILRSSNRKGVDLSCIYSFAKKTIYLSNEKWRIHCWDKCGTHLKFWVFKVSHRQRRTCSEFWIHTVFVAVCLMRTKRHYIILSQFTTIFWIIFIQLLNVHV